MKASNNVHRIIIRILCYVVTRTCILLNFGNGTEVLENNKHLRKIQGIGINQIYQHRMKIVTEIYNMVQLKNGSKEEHCRPNQATFTLVLS